MIFPQHIYNFVQLSSVIIFGFLNNAAYCLHKIEISYSFITFLSLIFVITVYSLVENWNK